MPYIGNQGSVAGFVNQPSKQDLTGATGGTLTLTHAVSGPEDISLFINNVRQEPTESYTVTGTTVTLQDYTVAATDDIYVLYNGLTQLSSVPVDGSVSTAKIADNAVTMDKLATSGTLPALDGSALTGVSAGKVLQVKSTYNDTDLSHTAAQNTQTDTGVTPIDMTRTQNDSKFLISISGGRSLAVSSSGYHTYFYAKEGSGSYANVNDGTGYQQAVEFLFTPDGNNIQIPHSAQFLYTPTSSTDDCSFKIYFTRFGSISTATYWNRYDSNGVGFCFTVMEIAG